MKIIALHGKAGAGKDTFADELVRKHGFLKRGFADPLYEEVAAGFDVTTAYLRHRPTKELPEELLALGQCTDAGFMQWALDAGHDMTAPRSPRWVLQHWGTEYRRAQDEEYWLKRMAVFCIAARDIGAPGVAIPDCRFDNEAEWVLDAGGRVVEILRPGLDDYEGAHQSAKPLDPARIYTKVHNVRTADHLRAFATAFLVLLPGCSTSIERSYRECLLLERDATYTTTRDMARMECKR